MKKKILSLILAVVLFIPMSIVKASDITIEQIVARLNERISGGTSFLNSIGSNAIAEKKGDNVIRISVPVTPSEFGETEDTYFFAEYTYQNSTLSTAMLNSFGSKTGVTDTYYNSNDIETYDVLEDYVDSELKEMIYVAYNIKTGNNNAAITAYLEENNLEHAGHITGTNNPPVGITITEEGTYSANLDQITMPGATNNNENNNNTNTNTNTNTNNPTAYAYATSEDNYSISFIDEPGRTHNFNVSSFMESYNYEKENGATEEVLASYESTLNSMKTLLKDEGNFIDMYRPIIIYSSQEMESISGGFTFRIKMTDEMKKYDTFKYVTIENFVTNATKGTTVEATIDGEYLTGTLPKLGYFALVGSNTTVENPKTGVTTYGTAGLIAIIALGGAYMVCKKKMSN